MVLGKFKMNFPVISCGFKKVPKTNKKLREYVLPRRERLNLHRKALQAQRRDQSEVCGILIADRKPRLKLHYLENRSTRPGHFEMNSSDFATARRSAQLLGGQLVGTFHSHPVSEAVPSRSDLNRAKLNSLLLIYDVCAHRVRLWRVKKKGTGRTCEEVFISSTPC